MDSYNSNIQGEPKVFCKSLLVPRTNCSSYRVELIESPLTNNRPPVYALRLPRRYKLNSTPHSSTILHTTFDNLKWPTSDLLNKMDKRLKLTVNRCLRCRYLHDDKTLSGNTWHVELKLFPLGGAMINTKRMLIESKMIYDYFNDNFDVGLNINMI